MRRYFYGLLRKYISLFALPQNSVVEIDPTTPLLVAQMPKVKWLSRGARDAQSRFDPAKVVTLQSIADTRPDYLILSGLIHYERDIQKLLSEVHSLCMPETRVILTYYSNLWRPFAELASRLGLRRKMSDPNWLTHEDIANLLILSDFELVRLDQKILVPFYMPILGNLANRYLAPLPLFRPCAC